MAPYEVMLSKYRELLGNTSVLLQRKGSEECNLGNVVADSFRFYPWNDIDISFINSGGLRSSLMPGNITLEDAYSVLPFNNSQFRVEIKGHELKSVLSERLKDGKKFLQVSGARLFYRKTYNSDEWILEEIEVE